MLYEGSGCVGLRGFRTLQARVSSRRRAGLRQYRSREGSRKRSSLGRRRLTHWIDLSATSPSPLEVQGALNETDPVLVASRKRRSARTGLRGDGPGGGHRQVAISMAEAGARRQRPAPSESFSVSLGMKRLCRLYDALRCNRSRRAKRGGRTLGSEIYGGSLVGFLSSTHRSHQKPLHVLIGSPSTIYEGSAVARTGSGGATKMQNAGLACPHGRRRQQFSPASV